ncbi:hypothetical protein QM480_06605 [Flectobacillus sp. DC10W]|uniref:Uncharacterized protein n=1 Tax=Flectobacillus longus TaxID=2984207 RepID=A0ABT6YKM3_9BACT|nr:hypothetical protein [Flectobacillus longus]MDI9863986.1 hypothetical protein [Flectobacillus longus]
MKFPLAPLSQYILGIDWMTTKEFCEQYNVNAPQLKLTVLDSVNELLRIDAIKYKMFVDHAKFLNEPITEKLLVFCGFQKSEDEREPVVKYVAVNHEHRYEIIIDQYGYMLLPYCSVDSRRLNVMGDLSSLGLTYNDEVGRPYIIQSNAN